MNDDDDGFMVLSRVICHCGNEGLMVVVVL